MKKHIQKCSGFVLLLSVILVMTVQAQNTMNWYGYFSTRYEKTYETTGSNSDPSSPAVWSYPYFNLMSQYKINNQFRIFVNINGSGASALDLRNFWMEYSASQYLNLRVGKIYRKFGLYNEILDAVPTYYGIEAPELFDTDHLMISRTTALMVFGVVAVGPGELQYSASTDNGEGDPSSDPEKGTQPIGFDLRYVFDGGNYTVGTSGYTSNGKALPNVSLGDGSPKSGVLPWMQYDEFSVIGAYAEAKYGSLTVQAEYWISSHSAVRDTQSVQTILQSGSPNAQQRSRFLINPLAAVTGANIRTFTAFDIQTWYIRGGYSFETLIGEVAPYVQWDWYSNPETIAKKKYGGDNEAGIADDGVFNKSTVGVVYRPIPEVALKFDQSYHFYKYLGENINYPEVRFDVSVTFGI